jgi:hypothetical protein
MRAQIRFIARILSAMNSLKMIDEYELRFGVLALSDETLSYR